MDDSAIRIAVLSGKGGTGKTFVAVNLASSLQGATYIDCDVEAPNGHLYFKPNVFHEESVMLMKPYVDDVKCTGCKTCVDVCAYNALAYIHNRVMVFEDICHSCGACVVLCDDKALLEKRVSVGDIVKGKSGLTEVWSGELEIGKSTGVPIIKTIMEEARTIKGPVVIDGPPGSACTVMEVVKSSDFCLLVAEPTLFGLHNLKMVLELVRLYQKPFGVILNKVTAGENPSEDYCLKEDIPIYGRIPYDKKIGASSNEGRIYAEEDANYKVLFQAIFSTIVREVHCENTSCT